MRIIAAIFLLISAAFGQAASAITGATAACGPLKSQFQQQPENTAWPDAKAGTDKALVYVVEDQRQLGSGAITVKVGMDGAWIGANQNNTYVSAAVPPGEHHLCVNWQSHLSELNRQFSLAHFTAEGGKTYYFRVRVVTAEYYGSVDLEPVDSDEGQYLVTLAPPNRLYEKR